MKNYKSSHFLEEAEPQNTSEVCGRSKKNPSWFLDLYVHKAASPSHTQYTRLPTTPRSKITTTVVPVCSWFPPSALLLLSLPFQPIRSGERPMYCSELWHKMMVGIATNWLFVLWHNWICWFNILFDLIHSPSDPLPAAVNKVTILSECLFGGCNNGEHAKCDDWLL